MTRQQEREHFDRLLALREQYGQEDHQPVAPLSAVIGEVPIHTVRGEVIDWMKGSPYGVTHDLDCPGCAGIPFTASPRSESYWSA